MREFNLREAFVAGYELCVKNDSMPWDTFLSVFHRIGDPAVKGVIYNPSDAVIVVDDPTALFLEGLYNKMSTRKVRNSSKDVVMLMAAKLGGTKSKTWGATRLLYNELR